MGQCFYVAMTDRGIVTREMPSEMWMNPEAAGRSLGVGHHLNTTIGVWFYERDLWDKKELGRRLRALAAHVTAPGYLKPYEDWGMEQLKAFPREERPLHGPMRTGAVEDEPLPNRAPSGLPPGAPLSRGRRRGTRGRPKGSR